MREFETTNQEEMQEDINSLKERYSKIWSEELENKIVYMLQNGCRKCWHGIELQDGVSCKSIYKVNEMNIEEIKSQIK